VEPYSWLLVEREAPFGLEKRSCVPENKKVPVRPLRKKTQLTQPAPILLMRDNPVPPGSQPENFHRGFQPPTREELFRYALQAMPPVEGQTEEERLDAAFERVCSAFIKAQTYSQRFDSPEQKAQEMAEILSSRGPVYQIAEPECLQAGYESALTNLKEKRGISYKTAIGLREKIDELNVWLDTNREEIQKHQSTGPYPHQTLVRVEMSVDGIRFSCTTASDTKEAVYFITEQNLKMFVRLLAAKEAWDVRTRRKGKSLSNKS
jgi:hypothetical protein